MAFAVAMLPVSQSCSVNRPENGGRGRSGIHNNSTLNLRIPPVLQTDRIGGKALQAHAHESLDQKPAAQKPLHNRNALPSQNLPCCCISFSGCARHGFHGCIPRFGYVSYILPSLRLLHTKRLCCALVPGCIDMCTNMKRRAGMYPLWNLREGWSSLVMLLCTTGCMFFSLAIQVVGL